MQLIQSCQADLSLFFIRQGLFFCIEIGWSTVLLQSSILSREITACIQSISLKKVNYKKNQLEIKQIDIIQAFMKNILFTRFKFTVQ